MLIFQEQDHRFYKTVLNLKKPGHLTFQNLFRQLRSGYLSALEQASYKVKQILARQKFAAELLFCQRESSGIR